MTNATNENEITIKGRKVTAADVNAAIAECDAMGQSAFLAHYGFRPSQTYWLRGPRSHRPYPSKAILAVAARCTKVHGYTGQFFGGAAHTVNQLNRLGFEVRDGNAPVRSAGVDALRSAAIKAGFNDPAPEWTDLPVTPVAVFASGSNTVGNIRGMAAARMDVGVAAPEIRAASEAALVALAGTDVAVFCDSGAFSEVVFRTPCDASPNGEHKFKGNAKAAPCRHCGAAKDTTGSGPRVAYPITDAEWQKRLDLYRRLAVALGEQLWIVAPDQIANQEVTLARLARYSATLAELADLGANILVVAQKGALSQSEFYAAAIQAAGLEGRSNVVAALPCCKAATTAQEVAAFVSETKADHVHLLGKGPTARDIRSYLSAFVGTETSVSLDACWITANVGNANPEKGTKARRYTLAQKITAKVLVAAGRIAKVTSRKAADVALKLEIALALCLGAPLPTALAAGQQFTLFAA